MIKNFSVNCLGVSGSNTVDQKVIIMATWNLSSLWAPQLIKTASRVVERGVVVIFVIRLGFEAVAWTGVLSQYKESFCRCRIRIITIKKSHDRLIYIIRIPILARWHLYTGTTPSVYHEPWWSMESLGHIHYSFYIAWKLRHECPLRPQRYCANKAHHQSKPKQPSHFYGTPGDTWG